MVMGGQSGTFSTVPAEWREVQDEIAPGLEDDLRGVWGSSSNDVWIVSERGAILHWDGHALVSVPRPVSRPLYGIWGSAWNAIWAVGAGGTIFFFDGQQWSITPNVPTGNDLMAVFGVDGQVFAVGGGGTVLAGNGVEWRTMASPTEEALTHVWASSSHDIWLYPTTFHWNGVAWMDERKVIDGQAGTFPFGSAANDVWLSGVNAGRRGGSPRLDHWDGREWTAHFTGVDSPGIYGAAAAWTIGPGDYWLVDANCTVGVCAARWTGSAWVDQLTMTSHYYSLHGLWGERSDAMWAVGDDGTILWHRPKL